MTTSFADRYRAANFQPDAETIKLRQSAIQRLPEAPNAEQLDRVIQLAYGHSPAKLDYGWFTTPFATSDTSFSAVRNGREIAVLAGCYLHHLCAKTDLGLRIELAATSAGLRGMRANEDTADMLAEFSVALRERQQTPFSVPAPTFSKTKTIKPAPDAPAQVEPKEVNALAKAMIELVDNLRDESEDAAIGFHRKAEALERQINSLAWLAGEHSYTTGKHWDELDQHSRILLCAAEMASFWDGSAGTVAAKGFLFKSCGGKQGAKAATLGVHLQSFSTSRFYEDVFDGHQESFLTPVHSSVIAIKHARFSAKDAWVDVDREVGPAEIAEQIYLEILASSIA